MHYSTDRILVTHAGSLPRPADLRAMVVAKSAGEGPAHQRQLTVEYPKAKGPIPVDDEMTVQAFREVFIQKVARQVAWQMTAHVSTADLMSD